MTLFELRKAERKYKLKKLDLATRRANLWLNTNWEEVLNKSKNKKIP